MSRLQHPKNLIAPVLILLLAALLRLPFADAYVLWADEFSVDVEGMQIALDGQRPLIGTEATFQGLTHHSPFTSYILAIPFTFFPDPALARVFVGLLGVATVAICYGLMKRYFGQRAALITALLIATMPLVIYWNRFVWNPNLGLVFLPLWFYTGLLAYHDGKRWAQMLHWVILSANIQSQAVLVYLLPLSLALFCWHLLLHEKRARTVFMTIFGFILFGVSLIPWGIGLRNYALENPASAESADVGGVLSSFNVAGLTQIPAIFARIVGATNFPASELNWHPNPDGLWTQIPINSIGWLSVVFTLTGIIWLVVIGLQAPKRRLPALLFAGMCFAPLGIILFASPEQPITDHFFMPVTFAASAVLGVFLAQMWQRFRLGIIAVLIVILGGYLLITASHLWWLHQNPNDHPNGNLDALSIQAEEFLQYGDVVVMVRSFYLDAQRQSADLFPNVELLWSWTVMGTRYPIDVTNTFGTTLIVPQADRVAVVGRANNQNFRAWFGAGEIIGYADRYQLITLERDAALMPNQFGELVQVIDAFNNPALCTGEAGTVTLVWQPLVNQPENDYQFSVRLVDDSGTVQAQVDVPTLYHEYWETDDWVISQIALAPSHTTISAIHLVLYNALDFTGIDVIDTQGNPINYFVDVPLTCED